MPVFRIWEDEQDLCGRVQEIQDKLIADTNAMFIHQLSLSSVTFVGSPFRRSIILQRGLPRRRLEALFPKSSKEAYLAGQGVNCSGFGLFAHCSINVTVDDEGESLLDANWDTFIDQCKLPEEAVISIWGVKSNYKLIFIIRYDGNMGDQSSDELPALPPFAEERIRLYDKQLTEVEDEESQRPKVVPSQGDGEAKPSPGCLPLSFINFRKKKEKPKAVKTTN